MVPIVVYDHLLSCAKKIEAVGLEHLLSMGIYLQDVLPLGAYTTGYSYKAW
jgi:hypothetical protein